MAAIAIAATPLLPGIVVILRNEGSAFYVTARLPARKADPSFLRMTACLAALPTTTEHSQTSPARSNPRWSRAPSGNLVVELAGLSATDQATVRRAAGDSAKLSVILAVYVAQETTPFSTDLPPMLGSYALRGGTLRFESRFPAQPGTAYRAEYALRGRAGFVQFRIPKGPARPATVVTHIYPSPAVLPENLLKFYVHFSAPMSRGHIYDHIRLLDEQGNAVELPFLEIDEELWDYSMTRLTLFIDPGRIKRGVKPLEDIGPALEEGKRYTLEIGRALKDGLGNPLKSGFRKEFKVGPPDRDSPDPDRWKVTRPKAGTRAPLIIEFGEPMDSALLQRFLWVTTRAGAAVSGKIAVRDQESRWIFTPKSPWRAGDYSLVVRTAIEDLAGNNIGKAFDVDLFDTVERRIKTSSIKVPFLVK